MQFPDRTAEIEIHRNAARRFRSVNDYSNARLSYNKWVESVKQQNINTAGRLERDLEEAKREFSEFVKTDPLYLQICSQATAIIRESPGILQTDLYKSIPLDKSDISYALYFAEDHGTIIRTKKGRTYSLALQ